MAPEGSKPREGKHKMGAVACMLGIRRRFSGVKVVLVGGSWLLCSIPYILFSLGWVPRH